MSHLKDNNSKPNESDFLRSENLSPDDFEKTEMSNSSEKAKKNGLNSNSENWKKNSN